MVILIKKIFKMKIKNPIIKIIFIFSILGFLYFIYKDMKAPTNLKGYYITQSYFFLLLSLITLIINFINKKIHSYFIIFLFSSIISLYFFEGYIFYKGRIKIIIPDENHWENEYIALQNEVNKKGGYITFSALNNDLNSFSGISNSKIIFCNEDDFFSTYISDRNGFNNPDYVWDEEVLDIVVIGDSMVHGACVNEGDDITSNIRKLTNLNAINLGWKRTGTLNQYARYLEYIEKKPRYIIWVYHENDLLELQEESKNDLLLKYYLNSKFKQNLKDKREEIDSIIKVQHNNFMQTEFGLKKINKYKNLINFMKLYKTRQIILYKMSGIIESNKKSYIPDNNKTLNLYFDIIYKMKKIADKNGTKLVLVYLPVMEYGFSKKTMLLQKIKNEIFSKMKHNDIVIIDIETSIKKKFPIPGTLYPKQHPGYHFNKLGYRFIAEEISGFIKENELK